MRILLESWDSILWSFSPCLDLAEPADSFLSFQSCFGHGFSVTPTQYGFGAPSRWGCYFSSK